MPLVSYHLNCIPTGYDLLAVMSSVTNSGALGTAAQCSSQTTCAALKDVLVDMFCASPGERTGVVTTQHVQW